MGRTRGWSGRRNDNNNKSKNNKNKNKNNKPNVAVQTPASPAHRDLHTSFGQTPHSDLSEVVLTTVILAPGARGGSRERVTAFRVDSMDLVDPLKNGR